MTELKRTPLYSLYKEYNAKTVDFGGWELPVQFSGIKKEHEVTRTAAGLFDVSHMGEILVEGEDSESFLQKMLTNDLSKLTIGKAQYTIMCYENGGTVDDLIVYKLQDDKFLLVVNAANTEKDYEWLLMHQAGNVRLRNVSAEYVQLAIQGPKAETILQKLTSTNLSEITFFRFRDDIKFENTKHEALVSRTGYTGEDGFEIYINPEDGTSLWRTILEQGKEEGIEPIGLGARDTLRFEAALPLYGQELSTTITPIEAGLSFAVKTEKDADFIGKEVLKQQKENGASKRLVGIEMIDKGIPRHGYEIYVGEEKVGEVTSGTQSPTLQKNIGLALVDANYAEPGTELEVQVRKRKLKAVVIRKPFYKR